jgi:hypothetical protein
MCDGKAKWPSVCTRRVELGPFVPAVPAHVSRTTTLPLARAGTLVWILTLPFVPSRWGGNIRRQAAVLDFECERQLLADIVAKVENRSAPKIWRKLILGYLRGCVTFQRHWEGPWLILDETIWSPTSARAKCISALRIFVRHPKKTFAISAQSGRWSPLRADDRSQGGGARLHRQAQTRVCTKNSIRVDDVMESPKLAE